MPPHSSTSNNRWLSHKRHKTHNPKVITNLSQSNHSNLVLGSHSGKCRILAQVTGTQYNTSLSLVFKACLLTQLYYSMRTTILLFFIGSMAGCIGTDLVDIPLGPVPSEAVIVETELSLITGDSYTLSFKLLDTDGSEVPAEWEWSSRNPTVAEVDQLGAVMAFEPGQVWIDGVANGSFHDSVLVTVAVDSDAIASVSVEGETTNMLVSDTRQLTAVLLNVDGDELVGEVSWMSNDDAIASIDENGLVTALSNGTTSMIATSSNINSVPFDIVVGSTDMTRTGMFSGKNGYTAMGTATLQTMGANSSLSFGSDFATQSGPGLYVYLSPNENSVSGGLSLGKLKSTSGVQSYDLPGGADPTLYDYVIIYCKPFGVLFGGAPLQ